MDSSVPSHIFVSHINGLPMQSCESFHLHPKTQSPPKYNFNQVNLTPESNQTITENVKSTTKVEQQLPNTKKVQKLTY